MFALTAYLTSHVLKELTMNYMYDPVCFEEFAGDK
jgi:hypothetical protein